MQVILCMTSFVDSPVQLDWNMETLLEDHQLRFLEIRNGNDVDMIYTSSL